MLFDTCARCVLQVMWRNISNIYVFVEVCKMLMLSIPGNAFVFSCTLYYDTCLFSAITHHLMYFYTLLAASVSNNCQHLADFSSAFCQSNNIY